VTGSPPAQRYRGRFAPSPSGALHFGSLVTAVGSYADARAGDGEWLVRMEDLDYSREARGAADDILRTLERFGLLWDGPVWYQSRRADAYAAAVERLGALGLTYPCGCSRREIALGGLPGPEGAVYPGTCRNGLPPGRAARSVRLRIGTAQVGFADRIQGPRRQDLAADVGDFVLRRADGIHAYQLAVVVDDAEQGINQVVRGADLLLSTPRQIHLQQLLGLPQPSYAHLPLVVDTDGRKLSKSNAALPVDPAKPLPALLTAWRFLNQPTPPNPPTSIADFWQCALTTWDSARVPSQRARPGGTMLRPPGIVPKR
jgi:glutamyl-Q tRNA(Asp) synthetase